MHLQGSPKEATKVQEHLEDPAKVPILLHQVLRLGIRAVGRIVKNFPEKEINILSSCYRVYLPIGIVQGWILLGIQLPKRLCLYLSSPGGRNIGYRQLGIIFWCPNFAQDINSGLVN